MESKAFVSVGHGMSSHRIEKHEGYGLSIAVRVWDGDPAHTVLLLHGYLDASSSFVPLGDALARSGKRVLAPDFRGHGASSWVPIGGYYHFPDYLADLVHVLRTLAPEQEIPTISIVAHSMGGSVATMYAGTFPSRVRSLALLEGIGPPGFPAEFVPDRVQRWLDGIAKPSVRERKRIATIAEAVQRLKLTHGGAVPDSVLFRVAEELTDVHASGEGRCWRFDPLHQTTAPMRFDAEVFGAFSRRITAPVLLVDGGSSGMHFDGIEERKAQYAMREEHSIDGAGHMMHWNAPDELAQVVVRFLDRQK